MSTSTRKSRRLLDQACKDASIVPKHQSIVPEKRRKKNQAKIKEEGKVPSAQPTPIPTVPPPPPSFSWSDAKIHLGKVDPQLTSLFGRLPCRPFDQLCNHQHPDAFRSLCSSIIGQQVSFQAARSITYRFIRLFHPHLPEKINATSKMSDCPFPRPEEVIKATEIELKSVGLSGRKISFVKDLASRFQDGRLETDSLMKMDSDSLMSALLEVRGIGRWTVQMFQIFCAQNPDILPHADLAIQKGLIKWYTTSIDPSSFNIESSTQTDLDLSPSPVPSGSSLSKTDLTRRLKKPLKPGLYLTPIEMEQLTNHWRPYRSIPVCYLWAMTGFVPES